MSIWGTPSWANGGKKPQFLPTNDGRLPELRPRARLAVLGPVRRLSRSSASTASGTSRTSASFLAPAVQRERRDRQPGDTTRSSPRRATPGSRPATRRRSSRSARRRRTGATRSAPGDGHRRAGDVHEGRREGEQEPQVRRLGAASVPVPGEPEADAEDALPERHADVVARSSRRTSTRAFGRKNIPIWITEYGNETKPGEPKGVTEAQQAQYLPQAIALAKKDPRVQMFIWFVIRTRTGSLWQSGIYRIRTAQRSALSASCAASAKPLDARRTGSITVKGGHAEPGDHRLPARVLREQRASARPSGTNDRRQLGHEARRRLAAGRSRSRSTARSRLRAAGDGGEGEDLRRHGRRRTPPPATPRPARSRSSAPSDVGSWGGPAPPRPRRTSGASRRSTTSTSMEPRGIEPLTFWLPAKRSPS